MSDHTRHQREIDAQHGKSPLERYARQIIKVLGNCRPSGQRDYEIFDDWLALTYHFLTQLPNHAESIAKTGKPAEDPPEVQKEMEQVLAIYSHNGKREHYLRIFMSATMLLLESVEDGYMDVLGSIYMQFGYPDRYKGQYFTPWNLALVMARMLVADAEQEVYAHIETALMSLEEPLSSWALASLMTGMALITDPDELHDWFIQEIVPLAFKGGYQPVTHYDPTIGSGVMLLAIASLYPS